MRAARLRAISPALSLSHEASASLYHYLMPSSPFTSLLSLFRVKVALKRENIRPWHEVEQEFLECEYRAVRDRQMKELEMEDDIMSKVPIRYALSPFCLALVMFMQQ